MLRGGRDSLTRKSFSVSFVLGFLSFVVPWFLGFEVSWFLGFIFLGFEVSWLENFLVSWFPSFKDLPTFHLIFLEAIDPLSKI